MGGTGNLRSLGAFLLVLGALVQISYLIAWYGFGKTIVGAASLCVLIGLTLLHASLVRGAPGAGGAAER